MEDHLRRRSLMLLIVSCLALYLVPVDGDYDPPGVPGRRRSLPLESLPRPLNYSTTLSPPPPPPQSPGDPDQWRVAVRKRVDGADRDGCSSSGDEGRLRRRNNTIIKTKDSVDAGAVFVSSPSVTTFDDCEAECCRAKTCNTAVVNLKDSRNGHGGGVACYLFDCQNPSVCIFTSHPGFTILEFDSKKSVDRHADELDELASASVNLSSVATMMSTTTASAATTAVTKVERTENGPRKHFGSLFSECHGSSDCLVHNTDCLSGYCICQQGYHIVDMQCRKDCNQELEFECFNKNSPLFSECIAVYDYCDGIAQCTDGSDESSCLESSKHRAGGQPGGRVRDRDRLQPPEEINSSTLPVRTETLSAPSKTESEVRVSSMPTVLPLENASLNKGAKTTVMVKVSSARRDFQSVEQKQTAVAEDTDDEVKTEKVKRYFWKMETNRGAVVALVLGIILTTALLILAGCRLRHFRKRYRKGRHLNSNEADYLINGMYL